MEATKQAVYQTEFEKIPKNETVVQTDKMPENDSWYQNRKSAPQLKTSSRIIKKSSRIF